MASSAYSKGTEVDFFFPIKGTGVDFFFIE